MSSFSSTMSSVQLNDDTSLKSDLTSNPNGESESEVVIKYINIAYNIKININIIY
jgi:hypothetical protein